MTPEQSAVVSLTGRVERLQAKLEAAEKALEYYACDGRMNNPTVAREALAILRKEQ